MNILTLVYIFLSVFHVFLVVRYEPQHAWLPQVLFLALPDWLISYTSRGRRSVQMSHL